MARVLFLCVGNSCRSQMAEGFARALGGAAVEISSGGTIPKGSVDEGAIAVMAERGIDISRQRSKAMDEAFAASADVIVTMGCSAEEACPIYLLPKVRDWALPDPAGQDLSQFRAVRDRIESHVRQLLEELGVPLQRA